ncbi:MAG: substrate-binding domain-containing protein [Bacteroidales bacterium]
MMRKTGVSLIIQVVVLLFLISCNFNSSGGCRTNREVIVFHAGSLTLPMHEIADAFEKENPGIKIMMEAAGSRECARKITELKKPCDIIAVADYFVIESMLMPNYANWLVQFAGNSMCIAFTEKSRFGQDMDPSNWHEILLNDSVYFGRSDPDSDPCGYRTIHTIKLAEKHYDLPGLANQFINKDQRFIRPKETDLLPLLESHAIDYIFIYLSVALQHQLNYLILPPEINLGDARFNSLYETVGIELSGMSPGETIYQKGEAMVYGVSMPFNPPNETDALRFISFLLNPEKGLTILEKNGQPVYKPALSEYFDNLPEVIKPWVAISQMQDPEVE